MSASTCSLGLETDQGRRVLCIAMRKMQEAEVPSAGRPEKWRPVESGHLSPTRFPYSLTKTKAPPQKKKRKAWVPQLGTLSHPLLKTFDPFFGWEGSPTKIDREKSTLVLASLLEAKVSGKSSPTNSFFGTLCCILTRDVRSFIFLPTNGISMKPLKVKLLAGEQKATKRSPTGFREIVSYELLFWEM